MALGGGVGVRGMAERLVSLKREFAGSYSGGSHIQEILPKTRGDFPIDGGHLASLHRFAERNPIYHGSYEQEVSGSACVVYEGDISGYWLGSIKHGSSCQPFYPTWILSAYVVAARASSLGCRRLVDIGSGDGRIAYCGALLGLDSHSIEIDGDLVGLQSSMADPSGPAFRPVCADATAFDYSAIGPGPSAFVIGGLPQMGGDILADSVVGSVLRGGPRGRDATFVLAGSHARRPLAGGGWDGGDGGWGPLIRKRGLRVSDTVVLPTVWTFDQDSDTPYIFARPA